MTKQRPILLPNLERLCSAFGQRLRSARVRRNLTTSMVAERASISLPTLRQIEAGSPTVSLGAYVQVLVALNLERNIDLLAHDDELGRRLQDLKLPERVRPKKRKADPGESR